MMMPRFLSTWLPTRAVQQAALRTGEDHESGVRHGALVRTDDDRELGEVVSILLDARGEIAGVAVAGKRSRAPVMRIPLSSLAAGASSDTYIAHGASTH